MRHRLPLALAFALACIAPAAALDLPARKAGLWEITMTFDGRTMPPQVSQHCVDAATDKLMSSIGGSMRPASACSKQDISRVGNTIVVDSICQVGATTTSSHGVIRATSTAPTRSSRPRSARAGRRFPACRRTAPPA